MAGHKDLSTIREHPELEATAAHIVAVQRKLDRLEQVKADCWAQLLMSVLRTFDSHLDEEDLCRFLADMKESFGPGFATFWDKHMPKDLSHSKVRHAAQKKRYWMEKYDRNRPNGPTKDTWVGNFPLDESQPVPIHGIPVVYTLFDVANMPAYVGSTSSFVHRTKEHLRTKEGLHYWIAYRCASRAEAYAKEDALLKVYMPHMNKKRGR